MNPQQQIAITAEDRKEDALRLAKKLNIAFINKDLGEAEFTLHLDNTGLSLKRHQTKTAQTLQIDFLSSTMQQRLKTSGKNQPLAKAIGFKSNHCPSVIDMTAGLGRDAFLLAALGCTICVIEQSPIVAALLSDALLRAKQHPKTNIIAERINLLTGDSSILLPTLPKPDIIYLDPMFPERKKSALVKKDMQILQALLGHSLTPETLLESALKIGAKRIVVKRPKCAGFLGDIQPDLQIKSKTHRFDVLINYKAN